MAGHRRTLAIVTLGATVAVGALLGFAAPAQAHDAVVSSTPAEGEQLTALPAEFSVTMNTALVDLVGDGTGFGIQVTDATGRFYGDGCLSLVDATMSMPATLGEAGAYTMAWRITSSDTHPVGGTIAFTWAPPADAALSAGSATAPVCGETEAPGATPEPEMTTQAEDPAATPSPEPTAKGETPAGNTTLLWLGGAAVAVVAAISATLLLVRPKKRDDEQ